MAKPVQDDQSKTSTIALGAEIIGEINANGNFRIEGKIKGNLKITGRLVVVDTGVIEGDVSCKSASIAGKMDGKLIVEDLLSLTSTSKVHGDLIVSKLSVEEGAVFTGTCKMDESVKLGQE